LTRGSESERVDDMAEQRDVRKHIEQLIERAQDEILEASRELAQGISKGTERYVPPISKDVERMVDEVFDFAERVIKGQRRMVNDVVKTINEQTNRAAEIGRATTQKATKRVAAAKKAAAKRAPVKKAARKAPAKKKTAQG
jgi:sugar-specific transcriptional regulator TrmB